MKPCPISGSASLRKILFLVSIVGWAFSPPPVAVVHGFARQLRILPKGETCHALKSSHPNNKPTVFPTRRISVSSSALRVVRITTSQVQAAEQSQNVLRGKIMILLSKLVVSPTVYYNICSKIVANTYWPEVAIFAAMANAMPIAEWIYIQNVRWQLRHRTKTREDQKQQQQQQQQQQEEEKDAKEEDRNPGEDMSGQEKIMVEYNANHTDTAIIKGTFFSSKTRKIAWMIQQVGILQSTIYISDVFLVFLKLLNFDFIDQYQTQSLVAFIIFSGWVAQNLSRLKFYYLLNGLSVFPLYPHHIRRETKQNHDAVSKDDSAGNHQQQKQHQMGIYTRFANRAMDVVLYSFAFLSVVDHLGYKAGFAVKSAFGVGSFGTLMASLASRNLATEFVGGIMMQSSRFFEEGDTVVLEDGTTGTIVKIGWLHTFIKKEDGFVVRLLNSKISQQQIARESRDDEDDGIGGL